MKMLPLPRLNEDGSHYLDFVQIYGDAGASTPSDCDQPSRKSEAINDRTEKQKVHKGAMQASRIRAVVRCTECGKHRAVFAEKALTASQKLCLQQYIDGTDYVCGDTLPVPQDSSLITHELIMDCNLQCFNQIQLGLYSVAVLQKLASSTFDPSKTCIRCGSQSGVAPEDKRNELKVGALRPMCPDCMAKGLSWVTWGTVKSSTVADRSATRAAKTGCKSASAPSSDTTDKAASRKRKLTGGSKGKVKKRRKSLDDDEAGDSETSESDTGPELNDDAGSQSDSDDGTTGLIMTSRTRVPVIRPNYRVSSDESDEDW